MKKKAAKPFVLSVPKPCSQNWDEMKETNGGRFCNNCQNTVIDFTALSNEEVYRFFASAKNVPCGRFHRSQLNVNLAPQKTLPQPWKKRYRSAAAFMAFLALKNTSVSAQTREPITVQPTTRKNIPDSSVQTFTVSGTVKNAYGAAIPNAEISFGGIAKTTSAENGTFHFTTTLESSRTSLLMVGYAGMNTVVRSYHPAMQNTSYSIVLEPPKKMERTMMGAPRISETFAPQTFEMPQEMNNDLRSKLADMAAIFRNNPNASLQLTGYGSSQKEIKTANHLLTAVKTYFIEKEGISEERFHTKIKPMQKGKERSFDIESYEPEE